MTQNNSIPQIKGSLKAIPVIHAGLKKILNKQIILFNKIITEPPFALTLPEEVFDLMRLKNVEPHRPILFGLLSMERGWMHPSGARLLQMEEYLALFKAVDGGITKYSGMLGNPSGFQRLLAELSIRARFQDIGSLTSAHNPTGPEIAKDYDVKASFSDSRINAEVKWLNNAFIDEHGKDLSEIELRLNSEGFESPIVVKLRRWTIGEKDIVSTLIEVKDLFDIARSEGLANERIVQQADISQFVEYIRIVPSLPCRCLVIQSSSRPETSPDEVVSAIRVNLQKANSQVPIKGDNSETNIAFVGSDDPNIQDQVIEVLFGKSDEEAVMVPPEEGLFSLDSPERIDNIDCVVFYYINQEFMLDNSRISVVRRAKAFWRPGYKNRNNEIAIGFFERHFNSEIMMLPKL